MAPLRQQALSAAAAAHLLSKVLLIASFFATTPSPATAQQHDPTGSSSTGGGGLPMWRRHYLLANDAVTGSELEPCSMSSLPRAWGAQSPAAQGSKQLPGTAAMQALIYAHQHPSDCSKVRFLVYEHPWHSGLGAAVDMIADALAWAMAEDRVLLIDYPTAWTRGERTGNHQTYCHGGALSLDECYLEPLSSCSLVDVYGPEVSLRWGVTLDTAALSEVRKKLHGDRVFFNAVTGQVTYSKVPPQAQPYLGPILHGQKIGGIMSELFWWRAQAVAYIVRPNARTLQVIQEIKNKFFKDQTIAPGTVSVHIRRGNKAGGEMSYVPDETFLKYIRALQAGNADVLKQAVFVSTEDPKALQAVQSNMTAPWAVQFTTVPRNNHNGGQTPYAHSPTVEALRALLNLDLALECDGWVGTLGSMWSVLIERLRSTVRCKADKPYTDAHGTLAGLGSV